MRGRAAQCSLLSLCSSAQPSELVRLLQQTFSAPSGAEPEPVNKHGCIYIYGSQLPVPHISGIMRSVYTDWLTETHPHYFANENWSGLVKVGRKDALLSHCLPLLSMTVSRALRNSVKTDDNTTHCIVVSCFSLVLPHPGPPPLAENTIRLVQL